MRYQKILSLKRKISSCLYFLLTWFAWPVCLGCCIFVCSLTSSAPLPLRSTALPSCKDRRRLGSYGEWEGKCVQRGVSYMPEPFPGILDGDFPLTPTWPRWASEAAEPGQTGTPLWAQLRLTEGVQEIWLEVFGASCIPQCVWAEFLLSQTSTIKIHQWTLEKFITAQLSAGLFSATFCWGKDRVRGPEQVKCLMIRQQKWYWQFTVKFLLSLEGKQHALLWPYGAKALNAKRETHYKKSNEDYLMVYILRSS